MEKLIISLCCLIMDQWSQAEGKEGATSDRNRIQCLSMMVCRGLAGVKLSGHLLILLSVPINSNLRPASSPKQEAFLGGVLTSHMM